MATASDRALPSDRRIYSMLHWISESAFGAGRTAYLLQVDSTTIEAAAQWRMPKISAIGLLVHTQAAPGAGESFTYTVRRNGAATALTIIVSGAGVAGSVWGKVDFEEGDLLSVQLVSSLAAATTRHKIIIVFV